MRRSGESSTENREIKYFEENNKKIIWWRMPRCSASATATREVAREPCTLIKYVSPDPCLSLLNNFSNRSVQKNT